MRYLIKIALAVLTSGVWPAHAADPSQIFGTILGEINRQIERKQQKRQHKRLQPLIRACAQGNIAACDRAADFPNLTNKARNQIWRMRTAAEQRPEYERNFYACQKMNQSACDAALSYEFTSDVDRRNLLRWQRAANQEHQRARAAFRRFESNCYAGSMTACDAALRQGQLNASAAQELRTQRQRLQTELEERRRQARQRREQQRAEQLRREQRRKAAVAEYRALREACVANDREACTQAALHTQVPYSDRAFLKRRERELAPITERAASLVATAVPRDVLQSTSTRNTLLAALCIAGLCVIAIGIRRTFNVSATASHHEEPPWLDPGATDSRSAPAGGSSFPLTGHLPTDVRRALYGKSNEGSA